MLQNSSFFLKTSPIFPNEKKPMNHDQDGSSKLNGNVKGGFREWDKRSQLQNGL
jgi:hypothetical protein